MGSIPGSRRSPGRGNGNPFTVFLLGKSHGQRSLMGYSPWGHKESDTTEHTYIEDIIYMSYLICFYQDFFIHPPESHF